MTTEAKSEPPAATANVVYILDKHKSGTAKKVSVPTLDMDVADFVKTVMYSEATALENRWSTSDWTEATLLNGAAEEPVDTTETLRFYADVKGKVAFILKLPAITHDTAGPRVTVGGSRVAMEGLWSSVMESLCIPMNQFGIADLRGMLKEMLLDIKKASSRVHRTRKDMRSFSEASETPLNALQDASGLMLDYESPPETPHYSFRPFAWETDGRHFKPGVREMAGLIELGQKLLIEAGQPGNLVDLCNAPDLKLYFSRKEKDVLVQHRHRGKLDATLVDEIGAEDDENYFRTLGVIEFKTPKAFTSADYKPGRQAQFEILGLFAKIKRDGVPLLVTDFKTRALLYCLEGSQLTEYRNKDAATGRWEELDVATAWRVWIHLVNIARTTVRNINGYTSPSPEANELNCAKDASDGGVDTEPGRLLCLVCSATKQAQHEAVDNLPKTSLSRIPAPLR